MSQYSHFWALYNKVPNRYEGFKEDLISQFTDNRTSSLRAMRPAEYAKLLTHMDQLVNQPVDARKKKWSNNNIDYCRKSVIASICGYFTLTGTPYNMRQVLATACRASGITNFNLIPANELHRIYNAFSAKQRDCKKAVEQSTPKIGKVQLN